jgi:hypothetical protein
VNARFSLSVVLSLTIAALSPACRNVGAPGGSGAVDADTDSDSDSDSDTDVDTDSDVDCEELPDYCCAENCPCDGNDESCVFPEPWWGEDEDIGVCKGEPPPGQCWSDDDCGAGTYCAGEMPCPCFMDCYDEWAGLCIGISAGCCDNDSDVPCEEDQICVEMDPFTDTCHVELDYPMCWTDADCQPGPCVGMTLCPCDADDCESVPGLCADEN